MTDATREKADELNARILRWQENVRGGYEVPGTLSELLAQALRDARRDALEEAAKECDRIAGNPTDFDSQYVRKAAGAIGLALRALKEKCDG